MILAEQRTLPRKSGACIWCGRRFLPDGVKRDVNFGPVERSKEHIIPESIFGQLITRDLMQALQ